MKIFLSYASEDRNLAEEVALALRGAGHDVFFDRSSLPPGGDYQSRIAAAINDAEALVFLISKNSTSPGSFALSELRFARQKWPHPKGRVLPVLASDTSWSAISPYLKSITVLEPEGNIAAEVLHAVTQMEKSHEIVCSNTVSSVPGVTRIPVLLSLVKRYWIHIAIGSLLLLAIGFLKQVVGRESENDIRAHPGIERSTPSASIPSSALRGTDASAFKSPELNTQCPEITFTDYSKFPAESRVIRRCAP